MPHEQKQKWFDQYQMLTYLLGYRTFLSTHLFHKRLHFAKKQGFRVENRLKNITDQNPSTQEKPPT